MGPPPTVPMPLSKTPVVNEAPCGAEKLTLLLMDASAVCAALARRLLLLTSAELARLELGHALLPAIAADAEQHGDSSFVSAHDGGRMPLPLCSGCLHLELS